MSKTKSDKMPHYELLYIISNKFTEDEVNPIAERVNASVAQYGGSVTYIENWGKRRLAYPIEHFAYAYYCLVEFDMPGANLKKLDDSLRLASDILRYQIVARPMRSSEEIAEEKKRREESLAREREKNRLAEEKPSETQARQNVTAVEEVAQEDEKEKNKVSLEDLDEKLDKILESNDLL